MTVHDVAVVGGGPAGASAARVLAEGGARVVILEKHALPRYKTCGGGLVGRILPMLPPAAHAAIERSCHTAELNFLDEGLAFSTRRSRPIVSMVMRDRFDAALVDAARAAGAEVRDRCEARHVTARAEGVEIATAAGPITARFLVVADGATSPTATKLGWRHTYRRAPALEAEVSVPAPVLARFADVARFDFGVIPAGYGWVFPKRAHLSIGVATSRRGGVNLHDVLARYLAALDLGPLEHVEQHGFFIPLNPRRDGVARDRVLLTGDAAGLADPLTGEGITAALESGAMAARAILDGAGVARRVAKRYEQALAPLRRELRVGRALARVFYDWPPARRALFRSCGQSLSEGVTDVLMGDSAYAGILTRPRTYRHLLSALTRIIHERSNAAARA
jgi:geranylgeranyl reductase family protein